METLQPGYRQAEALEMPAALLAEEGRTKESPPAQSLRRYFCVLFCLVPPIPR